MEVYALRCTTLVCLHPFCPLELSFVMLSICALNSASYFPLCHRNKQCSSAFSTLQLVGYAWMCVMLQWSICIELHPYCIVFHHIFLVFLWCIAVYFIHRVVGWSPLIKQKRILVLAASNAHSWRWVTSAAHLRQYFGKIVMACMLCFPPLLLDHRHVFLYRYLAPLHSFGFSPCTPARMCNGCLSCVAYGSLRGGWSQVQWMGTCNFQWMCLF